MLIILCGAVICVLLAFRLPPARIDSTFLLLVLGTIGISSRISIRIPRVNTNITVSDTLIFLSLLLYGSEAGVLLAACEGCSSGLRISKTARTIFFNAAAMACSTFIVSRVLELYLSLNGISDFRDSYSHLALATCLMGLVQYAANTGFVAIGMACKIDQPVWLTWKRYYLWSSISYFAGACAASLLVVSIYTVGAYMVLAIIPIVAIIYLTYETYRRSLETSTAQAEQAKRHVQELQESEERFRSAFDYAPIGMALVTPAGRLLQVNRSLCEILGYSEDELLATDFQTITHRDDVPNAEAHIEQLLAGHIASHQMEKRYIHKTGHEVWAFLSISLARDAQDRSLRLIFQIQDITDRKRAQERLAHDATHDALTGLPNRAHFTERLQRVIDRSNQHSKSGFAVLFLDADRFKVINDSLGHMFGDQLLIGIAERLKKCLRPVDLVARLGGDEFTVLLEDIQDGSEATLLAERIQKELSQPFDLSGREVFTSVSIGIALDIGYKEPEDILRDADTAMYRAKLLGKARYQVFDKNMHSDVMNVLEIETDLRRGVDRKEFCVHYQPIVTLNTQRINGFEALIRWQHPERGMLLPDEFIRVAEETELIIPMGEYVLFEACRQIRTWQMKSLDHAELCVSVNLSCKQFQQPGLVKLVSRVLQETGLEARFLSLEITESVVMDNIDAAVNTMKELRALGVQLSIDDFGTGYSSLSYLHRFPMNTLKIDRSFVSQMHQNNENMEIVRTIVMLARNLGMQVIAEGLETEQQLLKLLVLGCDYGQGYFFCAPADARIAAELLLQSSEMVAA
jgi:diguanylate cyclase (GGDEF)-like protein/PAS domain S-box-containing protein